MHGEPTQTVEFQELLAISAEYLGMGVDPVAACRDRSIEPFGDHVKADRPLPHCEEVQRRCA